MHGSYPECTFTYLQCNGKSKFHGIFSHFPIRKGNDSGKVRKNMVIAFGTRRRACVIWVEDLPLLPLCLARSTTKYTLNFISLVLVSSWNWRSHGAIHVSKQQVSTNSGKMWLKVLLLAWWSISCKYLCFQTWKILTSFAYGHYQMTFFEE